MYIDSANIPEFEPRSVSLPDAPFLSHQPDFSKTKEAWKEFGSFRNILLIGHGGSVTSFAALYGAFEPEINLGSRKNVQILSTVDPEYIAELKRDLPKHETLVIAISKSGETVTQIEALLHFIDYPLLFIAGKGSPLEEIGKKMGAKIYEHPDIGGRYTAFTEVALIPGAICGLDVEAIYSGARGFYAQYRSDNIALKVAQIMYALELRGFADVFLPFYSHYLFASGGLIVQLCHESFGKAGKGQSYLAHESPESQHHTNQRFFGGQKNITAIFQKIDHFRNDRETTVPTGLHSIAFKDGSLYDLHKLPLSFSMHAEFLGTWENAKMNGIPIVSLSLDAINPQEIGAYVAFWQMYAVYSSCLRGVDPFDQPQVENSKKISWLKRKTREA